MIFAMQWLCNRKKDPCYRLSAPSWSVIVLCNCGCLPGNLFQEDLDNNATHISTTTTSIASTLIFVILLLKANLNRQISLASVVCFVLMILCGYSQ